MRRFAPGLSALGFCGLVLMITHLVGESLFERQPVRAFADPFELLVYFQRSEWVTKPGQLPYRDSFSEYPLLPSLLFGTVRAASDKLSVFADPFKSFSWWWLGITALGYGYGAGRLIKENSRWAVMALWISPGAMYFSLFRFDILPALACMMALWSLKVERFTRAAVWLGVCIALKGYAAIALPAFTVFLWARVGFRRASALLAVAVMPMLLSLAVVWLYAGYEGVWMPFRFHAAGNYNNETIYAVVNELTGGATKHFLAAFRDAGLPILLQVAFGLVAAALKPKTFDELVHAFLVAIAGSVSASARHSPQFVMWIIAVAVFAPSHHTLAVGISLSWVSYLFFPILSDWHILPGTHAYASIAFTISIISIFLLQLLIMLRPRRLSVQISSPPGLGAG